MLLTVCVIKGEAKMEAEKSSASESGDPIFDNERGSIRTRAIAAGLKCETLTTEQRPVLVIEMPNGRERRRLFITSDMANVISCAPFEHAVALGNYDAIGTAPPG